MYIDIHCILYVIRDYGIMVMVLNATYYNISVLFVEETRVAGENHRPAASR